MSSAYICLYPVFTQNVTLTAAENIIIKETASLNY